MLHKHCTISINTFPQKPRKWLLMCVQLCHFACLCKTISLVVSLFLSLSRCLCVRFESNNSGTQKKSFFSVFLSSVKLKMIPCILIVFLCMCDHFFDNIQWWIIRLSNAIACAILLLLLSWCLHDLFGISVYFSKILQIIRYGGYYTQTHSCTILVVMVLPAAI